MKELSIEQKARRYDEAIELAREINNEQQAQPFNVMTRVFPELKENKDEEEQIRKRIIQALNGDVLNMAETIKARAWLEKQGKQKQVVIPKFKVGDVITDDAGVYPNKKIEAIENENYVVRCLYTNNKQYIPINTQDEYVIVEQKSTKVEPKFKVGNWYLCTKDFFGKGVTFDKNIAYYCAKEGCLQNEYGCHTAIVKDLYDNFKSWTIQDAKDGDVLEFYDHGRLVVGIVSYINKSTGKVDVYCLLEDNNFKVGNYYALDTINSHPATKEQRDKLKKAMADAGYTFDFGKKELKKIEQKPAETTDLRTWKYIVDAVLTEREGIGNYLDSHWTTEVAEKLQKRFGNIEQKSTEWSEEDEKTVHLACEFIRHHSTSIDSIGGIDCSILIEKLKSLRPQSTWKPSDNELEVLRLAAEKDGTCLMGLYEQLKKLMEE